MSNQMLVIFGAGGHAVSVANVARSAGFTIRNFIDKYKKNSNLLGVNIVDDTTELADLAQFCFGIAVGDNTLRERIYNELTAQHPHLNFPPLVHTSAVISDFASIGEGTVIMPGTVIGPNSTVGRFCILNTQAAIDHDCSMSDFSSLGPRAVTGGRVSIGRCSAICIGAVVKNGIKVGDNSVIGANSYLNKNLPINTVAYGTPAKAIRSRNVGDPCPE